MFQIGDYDVGIILVNGKTAFSGTCRLCGKTMVRCYSKAFEKPCKCHREKPDMAVKRFELWQQCGRNYAAAARKLGISRQALNDCIHRHYQDVEKKRGNQSKHEIE